MFFETRLSQYLAEILCNLKEKIFTIQSGFSLVLFSLFAGFVFGNLFGTFLDMLSFYFIWSGFVGIFLILSIEIVNSLVYGASLSIFYKKLYDNKIDDTTRGLNSPSSEQLSPITVAPTRYQGYTSSELVKRQGRARVKKMRLLPKNILSCERGLNSFKIGLLFGFFVDSFKVGS